MIKRRFFIHLPAAITQFPYETALSDEFSIDHAIKVLRLKAGEKILVIDPDRQLGYQASIQPYPKSPQQVPIVLEQAESLPIPQLPKVILAASLIKEQHWDWLLQKATELGVWTIYPLLTQHTVIQGQATQKTERWQKIVQAAAQQSEGLWIPTVHATQSINDFLKHPPVASQQLFLLEREHPQRQSLKIGLQPKQPRENSILLLTGPEGGWHAQEIDQLLAQQWQAVSLGDKILRSETASIAALSNIAYDYL